MTETVEMKIRIRIYKIFSLMVEGYGVKNLDLAKETEITFKIRDFKVHIF